MDEEFENFNDQDEEWLTELEIRAADLENELFDWREAHARELADTSYGRDGAPSRTRDARTGALRAQPKQAQPKQAQPRQGQRRNKHRRGKRRPAGRSPARHFITSSRTRTRSPTMT